MHLGRFHYVTHLLQIYFAENEILKLVDQAIAQVNQYVATPTPEASAAFRTTVDSLLRACAVVPAGHNTPSFSQIIEETGGEKYFGSGLEYSLRQLFGQHSITPAELLASLQGFRKGLNGYIAAIDALAKQFELLDIEYEDLAPDEFELGAAFPKELVGSSISQIGAELQHIDRLFQALNELMGRGTSQSPLVRSISSSWWQFFLALDVQQIAAATFAIERIVALYKSNLEIHKLKREAEKNELGPEIAELIEQKLNEKIKAGMQEIASEIRNKFANNPEVERCNELETQLRIELVHMARRINQGATYDIRAGLPESPTELAEADAADQAKLAAHEEAVKIYEEKLLRAEELNDAGERIATEIRTIPGGTHLLTDYEKLTDDIEKNNG